MEGKTDIDKGLEKMLFLTLNVNHNELLLFSKNYFTIMNYFVDSSKNFVKYFRGKENE